MPNYQRVYAEGHSYFITIVTYKRQHLLIQNIKLLRQVFSDSKQLHTYTIHAIVILPDHIHMIIEPQHATEYPKIISYIKRKFSYLLNQIQKSHLTISQSKVKKRESNIWQRRYYEHTVRDERDFNLHLDYIHYNPIKHQYTKTANTWKHSSFHKYVKLGWYDKKWCDFTHDISLGE